MDTVLGLSITPTAVGCVLLEGHDATGASLDHSDFGVDSPHGVRVVNTSEQATAAVLRTQEEVVSCGHRLRAVNVTWTSDAAADAALLVESLTDAGFDNVVPVRFGQAAEALARRLDPAVGHPKTAVCVIEPEAVTVVMADNCGDAAQTAVRRMPPGYDDLTRWLTAVFDEAGWRPQWLVVVASDGDLDATARQLQAALRVPVAAQSGVQLALAHGAALASIQNVTVADTTVTKPRSDRIRGRTRLRAPSYAGALIMLVAGVLTFVVSLSLAVGLQLTSDGRHGPSEGSSTSTTPHVARAETPPAAPLPAEVSVRADDPPADPSESAAEGSPQDQSGTPPEPENALPQLTTILGHMPGVDDDSAPDEPAPAQAP